MSDPRRMSYSEACEEIERLKALITELASVVHDWKILMGSDSYDNLLQRAREATR